LKDAAKVVSQPVWFGKKPEEWDEMRARYGRARRTNDGVLKPRREVLPCVRCEVGPCRAGCAENGCEHCENGDCDLSVEPETNATSRTHRRRVKSAFWSRMERQRALQIWLENLHLYTGFERSPSRISRLIASLKRDESGPFAGMTCLAMWVPATLSPGVPVVA
jgi:hypothetical protein